MNSALLSDDPDLFSWDQADCVPMLGAIYSQKTYRPQAFRRVDIPKPNASCGPPKGRINDQYRAHGLAEKSGRFDLPIAIGLLARWCPSGETNARCPGRLQRVDA
jgi:hypothetical protein